MVGGADQKPEPQANEAFVVTAVRQFLTEARCFDEARRSFDAGGWEAFREFLFDRRGRRDREVDQVFEAALEHKVRQVGGWLSLCRLLFG